MKYGLEDIEGIVSGRIKPRDSEVFDLLRCTYASLPFLERKDPERLSYVLDMSESLLGVAKNPLTRNYFLGKFSESGYNQNEGLGSNEDGYGGETPCYYGM